MLSAPYKLNFAKKKFSEDQLDRIMRAIHNEPGFEIPVYRKRNTFLIDVDVADPVGGGQKDPPRIKGKDFKSQRKPSSQSQHQWMWAGSGSGKMHGQH